MITSCWLTGQVRRASSAKRKAGSSRRARARANRCNSPPETCRAVDRARRSANAVGRTGLRSPSSLYHGDERDLSNPCGPSDAARRQRWILVELLEPKWRQLGISHDRTCIGPWSGRAEYCRSSSCRSRSDRRQTDLACGNLDIKAGKQHPVAITLLQPLRCNNGLAGRCPCLARPSRRFSGKKCLGVGMLRFRKQRFGRPVLKPVGPQA